MKSLIINTAIGILLPLSLLAAIPRATLISKSGKQNIYIDRGEFRGGIAGRSFILSELKRVYSSKGKIERYILQFVDGAGQSLLGRPGFYNIKVDQKNQRLVLEFSQVIGSRMDFNKIQDLIKKSPFVESTRMTYDPEDNALSLQLFIKKNLMKKIKVEVFELDPKLGGGRLALDILIDKEKV